MIETRVRVVESHIYTKYYPEYKGKFLFWDCWWDIDTDLFGDGDKEMVS